MPVHTTLETTLKCLNTLRAIGKKIVYITVGPRVEFSQPELTMLSLIIVLCFGKHAVFWMGFIAFTLLLYACCLF